jgi:hypothetical protein
MKFSGLGGAIAAIGSVVNSAANVGLAVGIVYLIDCRSLSKQIEQINSCYFTALPIMGISGAAKGGFSIGYATYNPALKREDEKIQQRAGDAMGGRS